MLPGGSLIPLVAAAAIVWLVSQATMRELTVEAVVLACAALAYFYLAAAAAVEIRVNS